MSIWIVAIVVGETLRRITWRGSQVVGSVYFWIDQASYTPVKSVHLVVKLHSGSLEKHQKVLVLFVFVLSMFHIFPG